MLVRRNGFTVSTAGALFPLMREVDQAFRDLASADVAASHGVPAADVVETKDALVIRLDMPGHAPESVQVKLEEGTLSISSERKKEPLEEGASYLRRERGAGTLTRTFGVPPTVDGTRVEAKLEQGVLTVLLPKREDAKPRVIDVQVRA
ncbi:MAG: Hsp20/alpha crystallin family protein [Myxococcaceae bacterium]|nr:Hsp20/alpha crystallin family protein [Myxococcaceae bacterium]MCI0673693.1 Hsp20/alpha crystallin family protein [Myxococcaceae bacterium]